MATAKIYVQVNFRSQNSNITLQSLCKMALSKRIAFRAVDGNIKLTFTPLKVSNGEQRTFGNVELCTEIPLKLFESNRFYLSEKIKESQKMFITLDPIGSTSVESFHSIKCFICGFYDKKK